MRYLHEARKAPKPNWQRAAASKSVKLVALLTPPKNVESVNEPDNGTHWPFRISTEVCYPLRQCDLLRYPESSKP